MDSDNWGGKRIGAGRKPVNNKTVVVRIPEFLKEQIKNFINNETTRGDSRLEQIETSCGDSRLEQIETTRGDSRLEQIETIISDWRRTRPTHSPSYKNIDKLLSELEAVFSTKEI